jgi:cobyrinic acid a,c-diamide synthase
MLQHEIDFPAVKARCAACLIAAPASGQGKTTVTAGLALAWRRQGYRVRIFKCGANFLDPMILARASGAPVYNLDLFMGSPAHAQRLLVEAALQADVILVEAAKGLYDGEPSAADIAHLLGLPVMLVIDGSSMAQTFGAIAYGLATYHHSLSICGVMANQVSGDVHAQMLEDSLPEELPWAGWISHDKTMTLPEQQINLQHPEAMADLDARLDLAANALLEAGLPKLPIVEFSALEPEQPLPRLLAGVCVAVALDEALSFVYPANIDVLKKLGADLVFFSPLRDKQLPACDAVWLPGGYPELHLDALGANQTLWADLRAHHDEGRPLWAESGGMLCLLEFLIDTEGRSTSLAGLLLGEGRMHKRLVGAGLHEAVLPEGTLRGHAFHYASIETSLAPLLHTQPQGMEYKREGIWQIGRLTASCFHAYFPSNPAVVAALLRPGP